MHQIWLTALDRGQLSVRCFAYDSLRIFGERMMRRLALLFLVVSDLGTSSALAQKMTYGEAEYLNSCSVCHGEFGKGDGPLGDELMHRPADLTQLSKRNHGEFPYWHVFEVIDGRFSVPSHGDREMPVWGRQFLEGDQNEFGKVGGEAVTEERIHQLTEYVQSLQK
jgi:mono/diheme cytochrome c family protein